MNRFEKRLGFQAKLATKIYSQIAAIDAVKGQWKIAKNPFAADDPTVADLRSGDVNRCLDTY